MASDLDAIPPESGVGTVTEQHTQQDKPERTTRPLFYGIFPVVAMAFRQDGAVDLGAMERVFRHLAATGVAGLMLFGVASEFYKLSDSEKQAVEQLFLSDWAPPSFLRVVSLTDQTFELAVKSLDRAQTLGADAVNVFPPYFLVPDARSVTRHLQAVAQRASIPMIVQYAPKESGGAFPPSFFADLAMHYPVVRCVKVEAQPPGRYIAELQALRPDLQTLVGYAGLNMLDALDQGASGVQPGCSFVEIYQAIWNHWAAGDRVAAYHLYQRLLPYTALWMQHPEYLIAIEKTVLCRRGLIASPYCRGDRYSLDASDHAMVDRFCTEFAEYLEPLAPLCSSQTERGSS